ncbi:MAG: hypothetical protein AMJ63_01595, partial [Myxococcales bacterium SG8_38_1]
LHLKPAGIGRLLSTCQADSVLGQSFCFRGAPSRMNRDPRPVLRSTSGRFFALSVADTRRRHRDPTGLVNLVVYAPLPALFIVNDTPRLARAVGL